MQIDNRQRALRKSNFVVMGFVMKVLRQDHTFVMKLLYTKGGAGPTFASAKVKNAIGRIGIFLNALCLM